VTKCPHFAEQAAQMGPKIMRQNNHILLKSWLDITNVFLKILWQNVHIPLSKRQDITNGCKNHMWHNVQILLQERADMMHQSICHVTCDKQSPSKPEWMKNTWMDCTGVRMSRGQIVTPDGLLGGQMLWVELSRGQFVGGQIIKAPRKPPPLSCSPSTHSLLTMLYCRVQGCTAVLLHISYTLILYSMTVCL
jgi:hypothetical protein